jgi:hypothetical protein
VPYQRLAAVILAQWREAERALADAEPGSPEAEWLDREATKLADAYQRALRDWGDPQQLDAAPADSN